MKSMTFSSKIILGMLLVAGIGRLCAQTFNKLNTSIVPLAGTGSAWVDFNNDDRYDLFTIGTTSAGTIRNCIYINNGNNTFNTINLPAISDFAFDFYDYNNDSFVDIFLSGTNTSGAKESFILKNISGNTFSKQGNEFAALSNGSVLWRDFDSDGDADILLTGLDALNVPRTFLYQNKEGVFSIVESAMDAVSNGKSKMIDADNDGKNEIVLSGITEAGVPITKIYSIDADFKVTLYSVLASHSTVLPVAHLMTMSLPI